MYRILKAEDLITSPAYVVLSAAKTFAHPTHRPNELWQTDFTYLQPLLGRVQAGVPGVSGGAPVGTT